MSDLIKREDAIRAVAEVLSLNRFASFKNIKDFGRFAERMLRNVPSADRPQEWIPCRERLPSKEKATYLVCTDSERMCSCRWTNTNPIWTDLTTEWHWCIFDIPQYAKVVAWMPLKPWKGADDE